MITMTLNTDAVTKALIQYLQTDLNMNVSNKHIDVSVVVGRKSADKPIAEVTATVSIQDAVGSDAVTRSRGMQDISARVAEENVVSDESQGVSDFDVLPEGNSLIEATEELLDEDEVVMPVETPETVFGEAEPNDETEDANQPAESTSMFG